MLQKDPTHRIQSADELTQVLDGTRRVPSGRSARPRNRLRAAVLAAVAGFVVLSAAGSYIATRPDANGKSILPTASSADGAVVSDLATRTPVPAESAAQTSAPSSSSRTDTSPTVTPAATAVPIATPTALGAASISSPTTHFRGIVTSIFPAADDPTRLVTNVSVDEAVGDSWIKQNGTEDDIGNWDAAPGEGK